MTSSLKSHDYHTFDSHEYTTIATLSNHTSEMGVNNSHDTDENQPILLNEYQHDSQHIDEQVITHRTFIDKCLDVLLCRTPPCTIERFIRFHGMNALRNRHGHKVYVTTEPTKFAPNVVRNQKYSILTFVPMFLFEQFRYFFNMYYLIVALTQFIPVLQIGFLFTYVAPLVFVLSITMIKDGYEDFKRYLRDREANSQLFHVLTDGGTKRVPSAKLKVGDLVVLHANQRVPADMLLMRTSDESGSVFIRTDQLDGETDWKLRRAVSLTQSLACNEMVVFVQGTIVAAPPSKEIYNFNGRFARFTEADGEQIESLSLENTLWASTVIASGTVVGCVMYSGVDTRSVMNASSPKQKVGALDLELNHFSKILFVITVGLAAALTSMKGFKGIWYIYFFRFVLLLSAIIPISMRVNLDLGKMLYSVLIMKDNKIPDTIVRTSTIPEELGRVSYLFSDKTGTLTRNVMTFNTLQMEPPLCFNLDALPRVKIFLRQAYHDSHQRHVEFNDQLQSAKVRQVVTALAVCHNVSPVTESDDEDAAGAAEELSAQQEISGSESRGSLSAGDAVLLNDNESSDDEEQQNGQNVTYQASSPDEIALVKFAESVGLKLVGRNEQTMDLETPIGSIERFSILNVFPFTSESKRMGIIVRDSDGIIRFYLKGAESVMKHIVEASDWLDEEVDNLARVGLRTLVVASRELSQDEYDEFKHRYMTAKSVIKNREEQVTAVVRTLERDMELLALTGVDDQLQENVRETLETLRNAGIRVWMLTGDKAETATCIGRSARLIDRGQAIFQIIVKSKREAAQALDTFSSKVDTCLVIDGPSLQLCLEHFRTEFLELSCQAPAVICCRCSPTQKAEMVKLMRDHTKKRVASIGDGGNDVNMIQQADVGVGIVGKEGKQASLAADFSITQFSFISRLLLWHGRNSYKRSARLAQFVIHRGLIISVIQAVFSMMFYFAAIPIYNGWLLVGYATVYTMCPVFSLVLDEDIDEETVFLYPQLYQQLLKGTGRPLSEKTFFMWIWISFYQGGVIMIMTMVLFENNFINIVGITFTALILSELLNIALEIHRWHWLMVAAEVFSLLAYFVSIVVLRTYFDILFILTSEFWWKVTVVTLVSACPPAMIKWVHSRFATPSYLKLR